MAHCVLGLCWELELVLKKPRFSEGDRTHKWPVTDGDAKFWDDVNDAYRIEEGAASVTPSSLCSLRYILRLLVRQLRRPLSASGVRGGGAERVQRGKLLF